ncbi:hypothetical protein PRIPAC_78842, partial [Pristionchus pacificus]|uniref:Uncharacterized protein n=1 Tax=Pristionchus pacificus TaxID=54126 RepID=A0A2A6BH80_PRIPA
LQVRQISSASRSSIRCLLPYECHTHSNSKKGELALIRESAELLANNHDMLRTNTALWIKCKQGIEMKVESRKEWKFSLYCWSSWNCIVKIKINSNPPGELDFTMQGRKDTKFSTGPVWKVQYQQKEYTARIVHFEHYNNPDGLIFTVSTDGESLAEDLGLLRHPLSLRLYNLKTGHANGGDPANECTTIDENVLFPLICDKKRLLHDCTHGACEPVYQNKILSCQPGHTLFFGGARSDNTVECSQAGWKNTATNEFYIKHSTEAETEKKIGIVCKNSVETTFIFKIKSNIYENIISDCDKSFRQLLGDGVNDEIVQGVHKLSCNGDGKIMRINSKVLTAESLQCDSHIGWKEAVSGTSKILFASDGNSITVDCIDSCTQDLIETTCGPFTGCETPTLENSHKITCKPSTILYDYEFQSLQNEGDTLCNKDSFQVGSNKISRPTLTNEKLKVACVSKCHPNFISLANGTQYCGGAADNEKCIKERESKDQYNNRVLQCADPHHYLKVHSTYVKQPAMCDPLSGWSSDGQTLLDFIRDGYGVTLACLRQCLSQSTQRACNYGGKVPESGLVQTSGTYEFSCPPTHLLRNAEAMEYLNEVLTCRIDGFFKKNNGTFSLFNPSRSPDQVEVECVTKCHPDFLTVEPAARKNWTYDDPGATLKCASDYEVLIMNEKRVFGPLTCVAEGWKWNFDLIFPFQKTVHVEAKCVKVCAAEYIENSCSGSGCAAILPYTEASPLTCGVKKAYGLFFNDKLVSGQVSCEAEGWIEKNLTSGTTEKLVDFANTSLSLPVKVRAECKDLCDPSLVEDICVGSNGTAITPFDDKRHLACPTSLHFALFFNNISTQGAVKCLREGWTEEGRADKLVDFTDPSVPLPALVRVECRLVPTPLTVCDHCRAVINKKRCTECLDVDLVFLLEGETCTAKSETGSIAVDDETTHEPIQCKMDGDGYSWFTKDGKRIGSFAAKSAVKAPSSAGIDLLLICGIAGGVLLWILIVIGIALLARRRKRQAAARAQLKTSLGTQRLESPSSTSQCTTTSQCSTTSQGMTTPRPIGTRL